MILILSTTSHEKKWTAPLTDAVPRVTVQHLSQQIFIGKTEIPPFCPDDEMIQHIDAE
jgi:hypothetical protein